jgi:hypothetical protein
MKIFPSTDREKKMPTVRIQIKVCLTNESYFKKIQKGICYTIRKNNPWRQTELPVCLAYVHVFQYGRQICLHGMDPTVFSRIWISHTSPLRDL